MDQDLKNRIDSRLGALSQREWDRVYRAFLMQREDIVIGLVEFVYRSVEAGDLRWLLRRK